MGFLKTDYTEVNAGFEPLPVGKYECIVSEATVAKSSTDKPMLKVTLTVREDVEQEGQKRKFFDNVVEQDTLMWKFQQIAKAAQVPPGTDLDTLADFAAAIQYKPVCIKNEHKPYNGEIQDRIKYWLVTETDAVGADASYAQEGQSIDISDDDLPF